MSKAEINVAICVDNNMLNAAFVLANSIFRQSKPDRPVRIFLFTDFACGKIEQYQKWAASGGFVVVPKFVKNSFRRMPTRGHFSEAIYLRLMLPELLPDIGKIIYLDADTVVNAPLDGLYDQCLSGKALAAMPDWPMLLGSLTWPNFTIAHEGQNLSFEAYADHFLSERDCKETYFNTGVMVLNLEKWRELDLTGRLFDILAGHSLFYPDQDALNMLIERDYVMLDPRWNCFASCCFPATKTMLVRLTRNGRRWEAVRDKWRRDPWIVHFAGPNKPWNPRDPSTAVDGIWWNYARDAFDIGEVIEGFRGGDLSKKAVAVPPNLVVRT